MKMTKEFTPALADTSSAGFKSLAIDVQNALLSNVKATLPSLEAVEVTAFKNGSVVAEYNMIITDPNAENVTAAQVSAAVETAITSGNFSGGLAVNTTYVAPVTGKVVMFSQQVSCIIHINISNRHRHFIFLAYPRIIESNL